MTPLDINRKGIQKLISFGFEKKALAIYFVISRPYLDRIIKGAKASHPGVAEFINSRIEHLLKRAG